MTVDIFLEIVRQVMPGPAGEQLAATIGLFAHEPALQQWVKGMEGLLIRKGLYKPASGVADNLTAVERAVLPYLQQLDAALKSGGEDAALAKLRAFAADPVARKALRAVAA